MGGAVYPQSSIQKLFVLGLVPVAFNAHQLLPEIHTMLTPISESQSQSLRDDFIAGYPDFKSFKEPGKAFADEELTYKRKLLASFQKSVSREDALAMIASGAGLELLRKMAGKAGHFAHFTAWGKTFGKDDQSATSLLSTLLEVTAVPWTGPETIAPLFRKFVIHQTRPDWAALSVGLWLWRPDDYCPIKISLFRRYAKAEFGIDLPTGAPTAESFAVLRQFLQAFRPVVETWQPRDWVDVQSFVYSLALRKGQSALAPPFDEVFESRGQAHAAFDWIRRGAGYLKLTAESGEDSRIAVTVPVAVTAQFPRRIVFNFGSWPVMSFHGSGKEKASPHFFCLKECIPTRLLNRGPSDSNTSDEEQEFEDVRVPLDEFENPEIQDAFRMSMEALSKKYRDWKGSSYRRHHRPEVYQAIFDPQALDLLLSEGLADEAESPLTPGEQRTFSSEDAMGDIFMPEEQFSGIIEALRIKLNVILQGAPGVGKSYCAKQVAYALMGERDESRVSLIQFHQSYGYEDFIQGWRPNASGGFDLHSGHFYLFCERAMADQTRPYVLIIDEINRGNLSRIFGELMVLLEPDKRGLAMALTYAPEQSFFVPSNLHVLGLMNTADRSLAVVDYALRRRFAFLTLEPNFESDKFAQALRAKGVSKSLIGKIRERMRALNAEIAEDRAQLGPGFQIGHSFFVPRKHVQDEATWFEGVVRWEILPLLQEYWVDDPGKAEQAGARLLET